MTIIFDEHEWAKNMIESHILGKKPTETLRHIARYYIDESMSEKPLTKRELRKKLEEYLVRCDPNVSLPKWDVALTRIVNNAFKQRTIHIEYIPIYKSELDKIKELNSKELGRLAFTLLCLAKYWDVVNETETHWVNSQDSDIIKMANLKSNLKDRSLMFHKLEQAGFIKFSRKIDNTNIQVCFVGDGERVLEVTDFRNIGYQYERYRGMTCIQCKNCGLVFKAKPTDAKAHTKYCRTCAEKISMQQIIENVMRQRRATINNVF